MKIQSLKDIKDALKDIPDETLERLQFGTDEFNEGNIDLCYYDDDMASEEAIEVSKMFPQLSDLNKLVKQIHFAQCVLDTQEEEADDICREEGVSSEDYYENVLNKIHERLHKTEK